GPPGNLWIGALDSLPQRQYRHRSQFFQSSTGLLSFVELGAAQLFQQVGNFPSGRVAGGRNLAFVSGQHAGRPKEQTNGYEAALVHGGFPLKEKTVVQTQKPGRQRKIWALRVGDRFLLGSDFEFLVCYWACEALEGATSSSRRKCLSDSLAT